MNLSSFYWTPPQIETGVIKPQKRFEHSIGFIFDPPHPDPTSSGWYYGEGQAYPLVYSAQPEFFAVDGVIGSVGGIPRWNPYDKSLQFKRSQVTQYF